MQEAMMEMVIVVAHSARTQVAIVCALIAPTVVLVLGHALTSTIVLNGPLAAFAGTLQGLLIYVYAGAALGGFLSFALLAVKFYKQDKKRLLDY
jgi:membrane associated rhomboid family serine protease